jgi:hypothetical protein
MLARVIRLIPILLGVICLFLVFGVVAPFFTGEPTMRIANESPDARPDRNESQIELAAYNPIVKRDLFRSRVTVVPPRIAPKIAKPVVDAKIGHDLAVTAVMSNPEASLAIVVDTNSGDRQVVRIGDKLSGHPVVEIGRNYLLIDQRGKIARLSKDTTPQPKFRRSARRPSPRRSRPSSLAARRKPKPKPVAETPPPPAAEPVISDAQMPIVAQQLGGFELNEGEIVVSVNGISSEDPEAMMREAFMAETPALWVLQGANGELREVTGP